MNSVSVVIPFYNRSQFSSRLLSSIKEQTLQPSFIYIIDNGSTLEEIYACKATVDAIQWGEIEVVIASSIKTGNANYARNLGMELANTRYVAFLDSDDWWEKNHLEESLDAIVSSKKAGVYSGAIIHKEFKFHNYSADINKFDSPFNFIFSKNEYVAQTSSYLVDKNVLSDNGISWDNQLKRHQDYDFFLSIFYNTVGWFFSSQMTSNIDWDNGGAKKNIHYKSMIRFLNKWVVHFPKVDLERYLVAQIISCNNTNARNIYKRYYNKRLAILKNDSLWHCQFLFNLKINSRSFLIKFLDVMGLKGIVRKILFGLRGKHDY